MKTVQDTGGFHPLSQARRWLLALLAVAVAAAIGIVTGTVLADVRTDQPDYPPGSTVYIFEGAVETTGQVGPGVVCTGNQYTVVLLGGSASPCRPIALLDKLWLQRNLAFESTPITPDRLGASLGVDLTVIGTTAAILGGMGGAGAAGLFRGKEATAVQPLR